LPARLLSRPRLRRFVGVTALGFALAVPSVGTAHASTAPHVRTTATVAAHVLTLAAKEYGKPYHYGASGPNSFDCSGFTSFVFRKVGISLPHSSAAQYTVVTHIAKADKRPGDLIFMYDRGGIYHVGIYAGNGEMWAATHTGDIVRKERIYSSSYKVGRA
jgi:cell wall-associated NlpC family hydrolase